MPSSKEHSLTVAEVLEFPSLSHATLVAGQKGVDRIVTSAMVLEAPDIENWGKRGQVILTSFYALKDLNPSELVGFFDKMATIGISGIVFKLDRLVDALPREILGLCNTYRIPCIQIGRETTYEPIMLQIMGHVIDDNLTLLNRFFDVYQETMRLSLKQPTKYDILMTLKRVIGADSTVYDMARDRRVSTNPERGMFSKIAFNELEANRLQTHVYYNARLTYPDGREAEATAIKIPSADDCDYYLIIYRYAHQFANTDFMAVENIVGMLMQEILKKNAVDQEMFIQSNNTVHDLLLDRYTTHERVDAALSMLEIDSLPLYRVLMIRVSATNLDDTSHRNDVQRAVLKAVRSTYPGIAYFQSNDRIVFVHNYRTARDEISLEKMQGLLGELHRSPAVPEFTHLAALSRSCDRYTIGMRNKEVMDIYKLFDSARWDNHCLRYENLGIYKLLLQIDDLSTLEEYIDPRILKLRADHPELFETLLVLCSNTLSYHDTAEQMFLHPKTIRYRVGRAQELVGIDVRDPDDCLQIMLATKIMALANEKF